MKRRLDLRVPYEIAVVLLAVSATLLLPPLIYGYLSWRQFDYFSVTYYIPFEEVRAAFAEPTLSGLYNAPLISMNMTSGHLLANMYVLTLGQLMLSLALGLLIGLTLVFHLRLREACAMSSGSGGRVASAAGAGFFATIAASSTGLLGCCGSALAGGALALAGVSSVTAAQIAQASPGIQIALILLLLVHCVRIRRRSLLGVSENALSRVGWEVRTDR